MFALLRRLRDSWKRNRTRLLPEHLFEVTFDDERIVCGRPDGTVESVNWDELGAVEIVTNDTGPVGTDFWWLLSSRDLQTICAVPLGAKGESAFVSRLKELPGFDVDAMTAAIRCTDNQSFLCWKAT